MVILLKMEVILFIENKNDKNFRNLSFITHFSFINNAVNFNKKLNISQTEDWINILTNFIQKIFF